MTTEEHETSASDEILRTSIKRRRYVSRTVRLDSEIDSRLTSKAEREGISVTSIIGTALRGYVDWTQFAARDRHATVSKNLLEKMMNHLTLEQAKQLGEWFATNTLTEVINSWFGKVQVKSTIAAVVLMSKYSGMFVLNHSFDEGNHHLSLHHGGGMKWSRFYEQFLKTGFQKAHAEKIEVSVTENDVLLSVAEPNLVAKPTTDIPRRQFL